MGLINKIKLKTCSIETEFVAFLLGLLGSPQPMQWRERWFFSSRHDLEGVPPGSFFLAQDSNWQEKKTHQLKRFHGIVLWSEVSAPPFPLDIPHFKFLAPQGPSAYLPPPPHMFSRPAIFLAAPSKSDKNSSRRIDIFHQEVFPEFAKKFPGVTCYSKSPLWSSDELISHLYFSDVVIASDGLQNLEVFIRNLIGEYQMPAFSLEDLLPSKRLGFFQRGGNPGVRKEMEQTLKAPVPFSKKSLSFFCSKHQSTLKDLVQWIGINSFSKESLNA